MTLVHVAISLASRAGVSIICRRGVIKAVPFEPTTSKFFSTTSVIMGKKVALILSGCGVYDGTELHEASACMVHLSRSDAEVTMFAPDVEQMHTIDHNKGEPTDEKRNVLVESARIARGPVNNITLLQAANFDAVIFPGGFGAAKNLSTFAVKGEDCTVNCDVERVIKEFVAAKKPVGLCCISPVLAAKVIQGCEVTIGSCQETAGKITKMKATHVTKPVSESHVDKKHKIVTTPAFMCDAKIHEIHDGIGTMISNVLKLA